MNQDIQTPLAIFYSDQSEESNNARKILDKSGLVYEEVEKNGEINGSLNGYHPPLVRARQGEFAGAERIEEFVDFVLATVQ